MTRYWLTLRKLKLAKRIKLSRSSHFHVHSGDKGSLSHLAAEWHSVWVHCPSVPFPLPVFIFLMTSSVCSWNLMPSRSGDMSSSCEWPWVYKSIKLAAFQNTFHLSSCSRPKGALYTFWRPPLSPHCLPGRKSGSNRFATLPALHQGAVSAWRQPLFLRVHRGKCGFGLSDLQGPTHLNWWKEHQAESPKFILNSEEAHPSSV
jgi:hypothetical protein